MYFKYYVAAVPGTLNMAWPVNDPFTRYSAHDVATVKIPSAYGCNDYSHFSQASSRSLHRWGFGIQETTCMKSTPAISSAIDGGHHVLTSRKR